MYGGRISEQIAFAFSVHIEGCDTNHWIISVVCGLATFPINFILKFMPDTFCPILGEEPKEDVEAAQNEYKELLDNAKRYKFKDNSNSQRFVENKKP